MSASINLLAPSRHRSKTMKARALNLPSKDTLTKLETLYSGSASFTASCLAIVPKFGSSRAESFRRKLKWGRQRTTAENNGCLAQCEAAHEQNLDVSCRASR